MYKSLFINTLVLFYSQPKHIIHTFLPATTAQCTTVAYYYFVYISPRAAILYCTLCSRQVQRNVLQLLINNLYFSSTHNTLQYYILCCWQVQRNVLQFLVLFCALITQSHSTLQYNTLIVLKSNTSLNAGQCIAFKY